MKKKIFKKTSLVVAISALLPAVHAWAENVDALINPNTSQAAFKMPHYDSVNPLYRQYNGINNAGINGNLDIDVVNRSEDGTWFKLRGDSLGLGTQKFGVSYEKQGDWSVGVEYNQIQRYAPYQVQTAVTGVGGQTITQPSYADAAFSNFAKTSPSNRNGVWTVAPSLTEATLKTERDITSLTASKFISDALKANFTFKHEEKTGVRMSGVRGVAASATAGVNRYAGFLFAPEPIDQKHSQFEGVIDYITNKYQLSGGVYSSFFVNNNNALNVIGGTNTATVVAGLSPIALAPNNSFQQVYLNGGYNFTNDTRGTFKVAYSEGKQDESFIARSDYQAGVGSSLSGKVETTEIYSSLSSRITKNIKLLGAWRYEDRKDQTPIRLTTATLTNNPQSHVGNWGKLEADYNMGGGYGLLAGVDLMQKKSEDFARKEVEDITSRLALRKNMSESINGTLAVASSARAGSDWNPYNAFIGTTGGVIYPANLADRKRESVRGILDWAATDALNVQFSLEGYSDRYKKSTYGLERGEGRIYSVDATYVLTDAWRINAWYSKQEGDSKQNSVGVVCSTIDSSGCTTNTYVLRGATPDFTQIVPWDALLKINSDQFGMGLNGKFKSLDIGLQYLYSYDLNQQKISGLPNTTSTARSGSAPNYTYTQTPVAAGMGVLPDTHYTQNTFRLFASYPLEKNTRLRFDYIYDARKMDDYTWNQWVYADGTKVSVKPEQVTQIVGITLIHHF